MKKLVLTYTFDASAKTIVADDFVSLESILLITNTTDNIIIYNFADSAKGGSLTGTTLTLAHDTTSMADTDSLQIFVDDGGVFDPAILTDINDNVTALNTGITTIGTTEVRQVALFDDADNQITDFASSAKQDTGNTSVASIDTKTPALGQALAAASVPVILPSATITTLTPPAAITGFATSAKQDTLLTELQLKADLTETQPVSLASVPSHAVTNAGTFAVQNTAATPAGTNNIGDVDVLTVPRSQSGPGQPGTAVDSYLTDDVNLAANTANQSVIAAPGLNKQIWVYGLVGTVDVAGSISIQDEDDTALSGVMPVGITGGFVMNPSGNFSMPWIKVATNKALEIDTVTCTFDGIITYSIVSV